MVYYYGGDIMEISKEIFTKNLKKSLALATFFVLYMVIFLFMFFTKGIYVNDNFYKKSANINTVTYTASKNTTPREIVLKKQFEGSQLIIDGNVIDVTEKGEISFKSDKTDSIIDDNTLRQIARQEIETHRGSNNKTWFCVVIIYVVFMLLKKYNTQVYSFFNRNRAPGESYYKYFDRGFTVFCIVALAYLMLSL